ncbi:hypothetical protein J6590_050757 [Homalodisca vitripennis]|nr:hypothetical protein J6590_050757 [Homalodisca vitripennis]
MALNRLSSEGVELQLVGRTFFVKAAGKTPMWLIDELTTMTGGVPKYNQLADHFIFGPIPTTLPVAVVAEGRDHCVLSFLLRFTSADHNRNCGVHDNHCTLKKEKPALSQPLYSKQARGWEPLCLGRQEPLTHREQTQPTPTVISRSRQDVSNCPCAPESRHCGCPDLSDTIVDSTGRCKPARSESSWGYQVLCSCWDSHHLLLLHRLGLIRFNAYNAKVYCVSSARCDRDKSSAVTAKFLVDGLDLKPGPEILRGGTTLMDCYSKIPCRRSRCQAWT